MKINDNIKQVAGAVETWVITPLVKLFNKNKHKGETENPREIIRQGMVVIILFFGGLLVWGIFGHISGAIVGQGKVKIETERKTVQHLEGGIVDSILVQEGDEVEEGQPLIILESVQVDATAAFRALQIDQGDLLQVLGRGFAAEDLLGGIEGHIDNLVVDGAAGLFLFVFDRFIGGFLPFGGLFLGASDNRFARGAGIRFGFGHDRVGLALGIGDDLIPFRHLRFVHGFGLLRIPQIVLNIILAGFQIFFHRLVSQEINRDEKNDHRDEVDQETPKIRNQLGQEIIRSKRRGIA